MYEELAWKNFLKTGDIESFLEYKKIKQLGKNEETSKEESCD